MPQKRKSPIGPVCIRFFRKQESLEFSFFAASTLLLPYPDQRTKGWAPNKKGATDKQIVFWGSLRFCSNKVARKPRGRSALTSRFYIRTEEPQRQAWLGNYVMERSHLGPSLLSFGLDTGIEGYLPELVRIHGPQHV